MPKQLPVRKSVVPALLLAAVAGVLVTPQVFARMSFNTIDTVATIADHGNHIIVTGPIQCDQVQWVDMRVTITQRTTGAVAEGKIHFLGTPGLQEWTVDAAVKGKIDFEEGPATVVALGVSKVQGQADDAHQWLVEVLLVDEH